MDTTCKICLLPSRAPGAHIQHGICAFCRNNTKSIVDNNNLLDLEATLATAKTKNKYDALVCLSGGKDSIYLLYLLKVKYGLNVIAFTTDMNIPDIAWDNINRTIDRLQVPHYIHKPDINFYNKMYRWLLSNQEKRGAVRTVCYVCAPLFEGDAIRFATDNKIPLIFAGYSPGQPDPVDRMVYEYSSKAIRETNWTPKELIDSKQFSQKELDYFWNPFKYPKNTKFPRYIAPFHAWPYSQEEVIDTVVKLGLVSNQKNASPIHSNCPLNWLLMYSDLKNLGYNPYAPEFSSLIREGKANKLYWRIAQPVVNWMIRNQVFLGKQVKTSLKKLGITVKDLKITRPETKGPLDDR